MAANKFATLLHRNTNKFVVILVYALLEWILIALLLFNSLLSYLIYCFSSYFGLKTPCLFCSRLDHLFQSNSNAGFSHTRFLCEQHCAQISMLAYCSHHRKLAEATHMCQECHSSTLHHHHSMLLSTHDPTDHLRCSCCHAQMETGFYSLDDFLLKPNPLPQNQSPSESQASSSPTLGVNSNTNKNTDNNNTRIPDSNSHTLVQYQLIESDEPLLAPQAVDFRCLATLRNNLLTSHSTEAKSDDEFTTKSSRKEIMDPFHDLITVFGDIEDKLNGGDLSNHPTVDSNRTTDTTPVKMAEEIAMVNKEQDKIQASQEDVTTCSETETGTDTENEIETEVTIGSEICDNELISHSQFSTPSALDQLELFKDIHDKSKDKGQVFEDNPIMDAAPTPEVYQSCIPNDHFEQLQEPVSPLSRQIDICDENEDNGQSSEDDNTIDSKSTCQVSTESEFCYQEQVYVHQFQVQFPPLVSQFDHCKEMNAIEHKEEQASEETNRTDGKTTTTTATTTQEDQINDPQPQDSLLDSFGDFDGSKDVCIEAEVRSGVFEVECKKTDCCDICELLVRNDLYNQEQSDHSQIWDVIPPFDEPTTKYKVSEIGPVNSMSNGENHNEIAEDRAPETPKSVEDMCNLDKRFVFDKRETSTESVDGSVASEFDSIDVSTIDQLKSALKDERRALNALYGELEEERSASSIAANQTMAMITRLQQEKASMQMEALQYQRMMEEQSEYDQEALHLLNDLMVKKEKEKQEIEKELEMYRKKVGFYESKEKKKKKKSMKCCQRMNEMGGDNGTCLDSTTGGENSDDLSIDQNESDDNFYGVNETNHSASVDVLSCPTQQLDSLDESLAAFEEERISILENLRVLVEKVFAMDTTVEVEDYNEGNLAEGNCCEDNGRHDDVRSKFWSSKGKRLLPLFDAALSDNGDVSLSQHEVGSEQNKYGLIEEMDLVYERLQALEADREFLKHSIKSMNEGGEGLGLLQEILQHLRDLRNAELHIGNTRNNLSSFSF